MPNQASNFAKVFEDETLEIAEQCKVRKVEEDLRLDGDRHPGLPYPDRLGIAFSGGGVRSASIALGVTQRLARAGILRQVHYISGISGGTYLMSWLTAWIKRSSFKEVETALGFREAGPLPPVEKSNKVLRFLEPDSLHFLRRYIAYLTPRLGLVSGDTLAAIAIYLRNVLLNQTMLASALISLTLLLQLLAPRVIWDHPLPTCCLWICLAITVGLFAYALHKIAGSLRSLGKTEQSKQSKSDANKAIGCGTVVIILIWLLLPAWHAQYPEGHWTWGVVGIFAVIGFMLTAPFRKKEMDASVERSRSVGVSVHLLAWGICGVLVCVIDEAFRAWQSFTPILYVGSGYVVFGLGLLMLGMVTITFVFIGILGNALADSCREWLARFAGYFILFGLASMALLGIELYGPMLIHLLLSGFHQPSWQKRIVAAVVPGGWLFVVVSGLLGGKSSKTSGDAGSTSNLDLIVAIAPPVFLLGLLLLSSWGGHELALRALTAGSGMKPADREYLDSGDWNSPRATPKSSLNPKPLYANYPISGATQPTDPPTAKNGAAGQPGNASTASSISETGGRKPGSPATESLTAAPPGAHGTGSTVSSQPIDKASKDNANPDRSLEWLARYFGLFAATFLIATVLALRLDVNEFSMNLFYRNRLVRTFLGASNKNRSPSLFTGFAVDDDIPLDTLTVHAEEPFEGPYPIWGTTLNITAGEDLAWQQRKGASFIYSPLYCGWDYVDPWVKGHEPEAPDQDAEKYGYRSTLPSAGEPGYGGRGGRPFIGTAMAASGAAASPNMGYHTRPAVAALLAIFNVRLGWWTGNPRNRSYWKEYAPGIWYLFAELFAHATDSDRYVYLSDGGHFENLGIYELVRRRVRFIICSDGDADPAFAFGDLANAVEHCRADFGVEIEILAEQVFELKVKDAPPYRKIHYAIGGIKYPDVSSGILLYIKSSLTGNEPADVLGVRAIDTKFPHDTTANQFFDESKFEAYRALGEHMMDSILKKFGVVDDGTANRKKVVDFYNGLSTELADQRKSQASF
jgi:hypothetical protein